MKWWFNLALLFCFFFMLVGFAADPEKIGINKLFFEHIGPQDAAIPSFWIQTVPLGKSTQTHIFVSPETFADVFNLVKEGGEAPQQRPLPQGTFHVTSFRDGQAGQVFTIYPETVLAIIGTVRKNFESRQQQMPEILIILETLLKPPK
jgi:hypothetical protein